MKIRKTHTEMFEDLGVSEEEVANSSAAQSLKERHVVGSFIGDVQWVVAKLKAIADNEYKGVAPEDYVTWKRSIASIETSCKVIEKLGLHSIQDAWASMQLFDEVCLNFKGAVQEGLKEGVYNEKAWERVKEASRSVIDTTMCILQVESERVYDVTKEEGL